MLTKLFLTGIKPNGGVFNNKQAAIYDENGVTYLLHNVKDFDGGAMPNNKRSFLFASVVEADAADREAITRILSDRYGVKSIAWENTSEFDAIQAVKASHTRGGNKQPTPTVRKRGGVSSERA